MHDAFLNFHLKFCVPFDLAQLAIYFLILQAPGRILFLLRMNNCLGLSTTKLQFPSLKMITTN